MKMTALLAGSLALLGTLVATIGLPAYAHDCPDHDWSAPYNSNYDYLGSNGFLNGIPYGSNNFGSRGYLGGIANNYGAYPALDERSLKEEQKILRRLREGDITPDQAARLQQRLAALQGQAGLVDYNELSRLNDEQLRIQQLLSSGRINANQAARLQDRLSRLQSERNAIIAGNNPYLSSSSGLWGTIRNFFVGY